MTAPSTSRSSAWHERDRAVANGDEHAIKLAEACLREDRIQPRPVYRRAAQDALSRLG